jgi:hypothetical protein
LKIIEKKPKVNDQNSEPLLSYDPNDKLVFLNLPQKEMFFLELYLSANDLPIETFFTKIFREYIKTRYQEIQDVFSHIVPASESQELLQILHSLKEELKL